MEQVKRKSEREGQIDSVCRVGSIKTVSEWNSASKEAKHQWLKANINARVGDEWLMIEAIDSVARKMQKDRKV